jgi:hypothetical protein
VAALALGAAAASAAPGGGAVRQACAADAKAVCSGIQPGGGRILACMRQNADRLSPACQQAIESAKSARQQSRPGG